MLKTLSRNNGFTLAELMVSMAIFLLVLGIGYNFYFYLNKSYKDTENRWIKQQEVKKAADFINNELRNAYSLKINTGVPATGTANEYDIYLENGSIKFRDGVNSPVTIAEGGLTLAFDKAENKDKIKMDKVLSYEINVSDIHYTIKSAILLSNLPESGSIASTVSGSAVHFKSASEISTIPTADLEAFCFIATAAYGSNTQPSVRLLRQFRDEVLLKSAPGTSFVEYYYKNSPSIAEKVAANPILKYGTLTLLMPIVGVVAVIMHKEIMVLLMLFLFAWVYFNRKHDPELPFK